jgi:hypothetical protein
VATMSGSGLREVVLHTSVRLIATICLASPNAPASRRVAGIGLVAEAFPLPAPKQSTISR